MSDLKFKGITAENWLEPDFPRIFPEITEEIWIRTHLEPKLIDSVPEQVKSLFEAARGSMIYGWFFYPLLTLGSQQCFRILEAAVHHCCIRHDIPVEFVDRNGETRVVKYVDQVKRLVEKGVVPADEEQRWKGACGLRNIVSHPKSQMMLLPGMTIDDLYMTANDINRLFGEELSK